MYAAVLAYVICNVSYGGCALLKQFFFLYGFSDGDWQQVETPNVLLTEAGEVNALAQGALRQFTQWPWIEHPTFRSRGGHLQPRY